MAGSPIVAALSWILLAGGIVFQYFVVLSGGTSGSPEPLFWFLKANTAGMLNAPAYTAWTFFSLCPIDADSKRYDGACFGTRAALPLSPAENFGSGRGVPAAFIGTHHYYYITRFMFAFYLIALFFSNIALLTGLLGLCTRIGSYLSSVLVAIAVFFQAIAAALMTAGFVQGRNAFRAAGRDAHIGAYSFGFTWAAFVCFFIAMITFCGAGALGGRDKSSSKGSRFSRFGRKRSTKSRGSFRDTESGVKDDYS